MGDLRMIAPWTFFSALRTDEDGASFLEYTVLLGIVLTTSIGVLSSIGGYANTMWEGVSAIMATAASGL